MGLQEVVWVFWATSEGWKHACEHLEPCYFPSAKFDTILALYRGARSLGRHRRWGIWQAIARSGARSQSEKRSAPGRGHRFRGSIALCAAVCKSLPF
jgi:hypothetical protein